MYHLTRFLIHQNTTDSGVDLDVTIAAYQNTADGIKMIDMDEREVGSGASTYYVFSEKSEDEQLYITTSDYADYSKIFVNEISDYTEVESTVSAKQTGDYKIYIEGKAEPSETVFVKVGGLNSGIEKYLNYNILENANVSKSSKFEMLQILKLIYVMEKFGEIPHTDIKSETGRIPIIDILKNPILGNISSSFSNRYNNNYVLDLIHLLEPLVPRSHDYYYMIDDISHRWNSLFFEVLENYIWSDYAIYNPENQLENNKKLNSAIEHLMPHILNLNDKDNFMPSVKDTFYILLVTYYYQCYDNDVLQIYNKIDDVNVTQEYSKMFRTLEFQNVSREYISILEKSVKQNKFDEGQMLLINQIFEGISLPEEEKLPLLKYALEHISPIIKLIEKHKLTNFDDGIDRALLVTILQEIMYVKKTMPKIEVKFINYTTKSRSLLRLLSYEDISKEYAIVQLCWISRIKHRIMINYGMRENIKEICKTFELFIKIRSKIFSFRNIDNMIFNNTEIYKCVNLFTKIFKKIKFK